MNVYIIPIPTPLQKMVPWLLLPHLPDGGVLLNVFYPNPNPETAFFQKNDKPQPRPHVLLTPI